MRTFLCCLAFFGVLNASAQYVVTGRVLDAATHDPLAFVPFAIEGTRIGTTSDIDGRFTITVPQLPVTLRASYVGYDAATVTISDGGPVTVLLSASNTELHAVEIAPTENPAHRIIRRVYANRKENDGMRYRSYRYTSYSKTIFDAAKDSSSSATGDTVSAAEPDTTWAASTVATSDTIMADSASADSADEFLRMLEHQHLFLIESATRKSFIPPAAEKETVLAMRVSGLKDPSFLALVAQTKTFSIYSPQIDIGQKSYLGPIGPSSTSKYYFQLEDTLYQGRDSVFVISYRPHRGTKFDGLKGLLYINTDGYAVQNVTAEPLDHRGTSIRFQQMHQRLPMADGDSAWFPVQLNTFIYLSWVSIQGMSVYGEGKTYLKDIQLDVDVPRKEVRGPELVMDKLSMRKDDAYWEGLRADSLGAKDLRTYEMLDSLGEKEHFDRKLKFFAALTTGKLPIGPVDLLLDRIIAFNDYEGLRLGAGLATNDKVTKYASLGGYFAYGFKDRNWKYGGDLLIKPFYGRDINLDLSYQNDVSETGGVSFQGTSKTFGTDSYRLFFMDRMDRIERYAATLMFRAGSSLKLWVGTERALRVNDLGYRYVEPQNEDITLLRNDFLTGAVTLDLRWAFHERLARLPDREISLGTKFPVVHVHAMRAVKGLWEGEWDTWRVDAMVEKTFKIRLLGDLSLQLMGGVADAEAPMPFLYNMRGINDPHFPVAGGNVFETMRPDEFLADRYVSFHLKHSFGALLVKTKHFRPRPAIVSSVAFGDLSHPESHQGLDFTPLRKGFYESGVMVDNLLRFGFSSFGVGLYYRYGPYALPDQSDNFVVKLTMGYAF
jgi:hypothetical protein